MKIFIDTKRTDKNIFAWAMQGSTQEVLSRLPAKVYLLDTGNKHFSYGKCRSFVSRKYTLARETA